MWNHLHVSMHETLKLPHLTLILLAQSKCPNYASLMVCSSAIESLDAVMVTWDGFGCKELTLIKKQ